ncbi:metallophosphoesterase [Anatilimnocola sp. NA78]|uniref:metallophosphoesterase n=1 Tax=Anatilimnocola sp. NA78 TaxID=3415683 RepID=UPI003CE49F4C
MELALFCLLIPFAALGHFAATLWLFNRLHGEAWPYRLRQTLERLLFLAAISIPLVVAWQSPNFYYRPILDIDTWSNLSTLTMLSAVYFWCCIVACLQIIPIWLIPKLRYTTPAELIATETRELNLREQLPSIPVQGLFPRFCASLPGNQIFHLQVQTKHLKLRNLPPALKGLRIAHLTDIHLTGKVGWEFYAEVIRLTNELQPDLILLTGDIAERTRCLPWIQPLFGSLQAPLGKFFILGNHDFLLPEATLLREELRRCGFVDIAGRSQQLSIRDVPVLIAGNELPWHGPAPSVPLKSAKSPEPSYPEPEFRLLLAHTPDLFAWAQQQEFDLMLAGHNHGGQIRLPWIGPLISPSRFGTRYAAGLFREGPTLMHVGRGISGEHLLRFNCPPELTLLILD